MRGLDGLDGCDPVHQPSPPSPMVLCVRQGEQDSIFSSMSALLSHTQRCVLVVPSSLARLAIVIDSLDWKFGSRGSSVGIPMTDCRDLLEGSPNARFVNPSRSVSCTLCTIFAWVGEKRRLGKGPFGPELHRRTDDQAEKRGRLSCAQAIEPVALSVLPLVFSLPVPAIPCLSLLYPCPTAWALPHLPLQSCPVSRDFPQSACSNSSTSSGPRRSSWEGGLHWDALQLPLCPLPRGCHSASWERRGDEPERNAGLSVQRETFDLPDFYSTFHCSIIAYLHEIDRYVPLDPPAVSQSSILQSSILRYIAVTSFALSPTSPDTVSASQSASPASDSEFLLIAS